MVQTPNFSLTLRNSPEMMYPLQDLCPVDIDSEVVVSTKQIHLFVLSLVHQHMGMRNYITYGAGAACKDDGGRRLYGGTSVFPLVFRDSSFCVHFAADFKLVGGFKLFFSLHKASASFAEEWSSPALAPWNCSTPEWPEFRDHVRCNMIEECRNGEDETDCGYTRCESSSGSGVRGFFVDGSCLTLKQGVQYQGTPGVVSAISARQARSSCAAVGARLATLGTRRKLKGVLDLLWRRRITSFFVGLTASFSSLPLDYYQLSIWEDQTIGYSAQFLVYVREEINGVRLCSYLTDYNTGSDFFDQYASGYIKEEVFVNTFCSTNRSSEFLCEYTDHESSTHSNRSSGPQPLTMSAALREVSGLSIILCQPHLHYVHRFLARDADTGCDGNDLEFLQQALKSQPGQVPAPSKFQCLAAGMQVHYTFVCDFRADCRDGSDEEFCVFGPCTGSTPFTCLDNSQCYSYEEYCNGVEWCINGGDEINCAFAKDRIYIKHPPAVINFHKGGKIDYTALGMTEASSQTDITSILVVPHCPETHFQCNDEGYCLPVYLRCNRIFDCPNQEDEEGCRVDQVTCPGLYRCRKSSVCVHLSHVCDDLPHCPYRDDELLCGFSCPQNCSCHGLAFICPASFPAWSYPPIRYLNGSGSGMELDLFFNNSFLIFLSLARSGLTVIPQVCLQNLLTLDLSRNTLTNVKVTDFKCMNNLREIVLAHNALTAVFSSSQENLFALKSLILLDLSNVQMYSMDLNVLSKFENLKSLNLSNCGIKQLHSTTNVMHVQVLDLRGNPLLVFSSNVLRTMNDLTVVFSDNYRLCCSAVLPDNFNPTNCYTQYDEISSCQDLLRSNINRMFMITFVILILVLNTGAFCFRLYSLLAERVSGFSVFVLHLGLADWLMGLYLAIVCLADSLYRDVYLWHDQTWRDSAACSVAGFFGLLSREVSALTVCLITLDRFLVVRFPFSSVHFRRQSAQLASGLVWLTGVVLATVPLFPLTNGWTFYSQTGVCLPLPITRQSFPGQPYAFAVMIALNMILFIGVAIGQSAIYTAIRSNTMRTEGDSRQKQQNTSIVRRLIAIAVADFLCWFPVGLLGLLASLGASVPSGTNVALVTMVIPLNSTINPVVYTLSSLMEKRRLGREQKLLSWLKSQRREN